MAVLSNRRPDLIGGLYFLDDQMISDPLVIANKLMNILLTLEMTYIET